ncbi:hypothetical protein HDU91_006641, partial [Kappamyces sp. JEL0680]
MNKFRSLVNDFQSETSIALVFDLAGNLALPGWICLALIPDWAITTMVVKVSVILNSCLYALYISTIFIKYKRPQGTGTKDKESSALPDFSSWKGVLALFRKGKETGLLAAWIHYLAFDLVCGWLIAQDGLRHDIS